MLIMAVIISLSILSCDNSDEDTPVPTPVDGEGKLSLFFDNKYNPMNSEELELGKTYITAAGDSITISTLRYWVSNIKLYNGSELAYEDVDGYYLVEKTASNTRQMIDLENIPAGTYTKVEFSIGVNAAVNDTLGSGKGELNLTDGMFWSWNTGYKFLRMDGSFYNPDSSNYQPLRVHTGFDSYYITKEMDLSGFEVAKDGNHEFHFMVAVNRIFDGQPNVLDVKEKNGIWMFFSPEDAWDRMNTNIENMFMLHHAE